MDSVEDKVRGFAVGAMDYIVKPFEEQEVIARINTHLKLRHLLNDLEEQNEKLKTALNEIKTLRGVLPICSMCKQIRDDKGY